MAGHPTLQQAANAADILLKCNGHDLDQWSDGELPNDDLTFGLRGILRKCAAKSRPREFLKWAVDMFGSVALDEDERTARFVEEAIEVAWAQGMSRDLLNRIVERVYFRPAGEHAKEIGQAMATIELLAESKGLSADDLATAEFERVQSIPKEEWDRRHAAKVAIGIAS